MKKAEVISILAASVRPREAKDRARYDEAVRMAIEALKCSETPKSSERTAETTQTDHIADTGRKVEQTGEIAQNAQNDDLISRQAAIDALEKCMSCKHVYQRIDDADTLYCRCRKGCKYEEFKPRRSNRNLKRYED